MRRHRVRAAAALLGLAGCGVLPGCAGGRAPAAAPADRPGGAAVAGQAAGAQTGAGGARPGETMPLERRPIVLRCAGAARSVAAPAPTFLHVEGLASDGWGALGALPDIGPVSAGGLLYRFVTAFLYLTPQSAPETSVSVVSPTGAWLYYTDFGTWAGGGNPLAPPVPHGPSKQVRVGACPDGGRPAAYTGGILVPGPTCVTLRFARSDTRTGSTATFRYGVPTC